MRTKDKVESFLGELCPFMTDSCLFSRFTPQSQPLNLKRQSSNRHNPFINPSSLFFTPLRVRLIFSEKKKKSLFREKALATIGAVVSSPLSFDSPIPVDVHVQTFYPRELDLISNLQNSKSLYSSFQLIVYRLFAFLDMCS